MFKPKCTNLGYYVSVRVNRRITGVVKICYMCIMTQKHEYLSLEFKVNLIVFILTQTLSKFEQDFNECKVEHFYERITLCFMLVYKQTMDDFLRLNNCFSLTNLKVDFCNISVFRLILQPLCNFI